MAYQTAIYGYAGNGSMEPGDATPTGSPVFFTPTTSDDREVHDVTALVTPGVVAAGWAGFSVHQEPLRTTYAAWSCPDATLYPVLTVNYTTPDPVVDTDADGVVDADDLCPGTVVDAFAELKAEPLQLRRNRDGLWAQEQPAVHDGSRPAGAPPRRSSAPWAWAAETRGSGFPALSSKPGLPRSPDLASAQSRAPAPVRRDGGFLIGLGRPKAVSRGPR